MIHMGNDIAAVASVWLVVRITRPYLSGLFRVARLPSLDGPGVWFLVYLAALFIVALESANNGEVLSTAGLLQQALGVTAAAIGTDQVVKVTHPD